MGPVRFGLRRAVQALLLLAAVLLIIRAATDVLDPVPAGPVPPQEVRVAGAFHGELFFNDRPATRQSSQLLLHHIKGANKSVDAAIYSFRHGPLHQALITRAKGGLQVRMIVAAQSWLRVTDLFADRDSPPYGIRPTVSADHRAFMHHKFWLFDRGTEAASLITGSLNPTILQEAYDPSFLLLTHNPQLLEAYGEELDRIHKGYTGYKKIRRDDYRPRHRRWRFDNGFVELWWSPGVASNSVKVRIKELIRASQERLEIILWRFNDRELAGELLRAAQRGVAVTLITDDAFVQAEGSHVKELLEADSPKIRVLTDEKYQQTVKQIAKLPFDDFNPYIHQHTLIVDGRVALSGTANWSFAGFYKNDENTLVSDVDWWVQGFQDSFAYHERMLR